MDELFKIANEEFYFDLDRISDYIKVEQDRSIDELLSTNLVEEEEESLESEVPVYSTGPEQNLQMVDITKWEVIKALIETILNENGMIDESMGIQKLERELSIPFRLSFNTLIKNKLIRKNG
jgi:hypothetical protein